jgi:MinD superfamily P-loop ATPase
MNNEMSNRIKSFCNEQEIPVLAEIPYKEEFTLAMINCMSINEYDQDLKLVKELEIVLKNLLKTNLCQ